MGYLCILWHFHQPYYADIEKNIIDTSIMTFRTLQNYYPMGILIDEFDNLKINFNITPTLLKQIKLISEGIIEDIFLKIFEYEIPENLLINFYNEFPPMFLKNKRLNILREKIEMNLHTKKDIFDFKFLLHLICFNKLTIDGEIEELIEKGRDFNEKDVEILIDKEKKIFKNVIPLYKNLLENKKIEISTSPFYHPILPLIYNSDVIIKTKTNFKSIDIKFSFPDDAEKQIEKGIFYFEGIFGRRPSGIWPSEGALSDEIIDLFIKKNIKWTATDETILFETLKNPDRKNLYKFYKYKDGIFIFFRDHFLSDLIGFSYQNMDEEEAAIDLIKKIENIFEREPEGIITIILDGENPWDYYRENGIIFLKKFYSLLSENKNIKTMTFSEIIENLKPDGNIESIVPGTWMGVNFDNWIGKEEANKAWKVLKEIREKVEKSGTKDEIIEETILNLEGSDWFWWYSIDANRSVKEKFDRYFKENIIKICEKLNIPFPEELNEKIISNENIPFIKPVIDGKISSFYEWKDAIEINPQNLWLTFKPFEIPLKKIFYGYDEENLYFRFDFEEKFEFLEILIDDEKYKIASDSFKSDEIEWKLDEILEVRIKRIQGKEKVNLKFQINLNGNLLILPPYNKISLVFEKEWIV